MKKVTNITIGSIVFAVEEGAYDTLAGYLKSIEETYQFSDDYEEISDDIERAIAEKFSAAGKNERQAVTSDDVDQVMRELGNVADFTEESVGGAPGSNTAEEAPAAAPERTVRKRLYRDTDNAILGGVAAGIANYFDIDPVIVRIAFVLSVFFTGIGIFVYLILWLVVPAAETTAQKYAMHGDEVTISNITEQVKKKISDIETTELPKVKRVMARAGSTMTNVAKESRAPILTLVSIISVVVGIVLVFASAVSLSALAAVSSVMWFQGSQLVDEEIRLAIVNVLTDPTGYVFFIALLIAVLIPLLAVLLVGISFIVRRNIFTTGKAITLGVVWVIALTLTGVLGVWYGSALFTPMLQLHDGDAHVELNWNERGFHLEVEDNKDRVFMNFEN